MVELLVIGLCLKTTEAACESSAIAYYKYSGIERSLTDKSKLYYSNYPVMSNVVAYTAVAAQGRLILNLGGGNYLTADKSTGIVGYRSEF